MSAAPDNPPAFPTTRSVSGKATSAYLADSCARIETFGGMTLRDWFAGHAIQGVLASGKANYAQIEETGAAAVVALAFAIADTALAQRQLSQ